MGDADVLRGDDGWRVRGRVGVVVLFLTELMRKIC
jgi:hypothetical protein